MLSIQLRLYEQFQVIDSREGLERKMDGWQRRIEGHRARGRKTRGHDIGLSLYNHHTTNILLNWTQQKLNNTREVKR